MNPIPTKVLILGGYGTFGGRLAQLLAGDARVTLLIGGRSFGQAQTVEVDRRTGLAIEVAAYNQTVSTADRREGVRAAIERRAPKFTGS